VITAIDLPPLSFARHSTYRKVRDRASFAFALAAAAVALDVQSGTIRGARVALGGVGTKPWRSHEAEHALIGRPATIATYRAAADAALAAARPQSQNRFKIELAKRTLTRALTEVSA
jgi:xanthine dehydrogenase YagS FAD-binding subunit